MSTRGFLGFVVDGAEKIAYNHSDSYPDGLGLDVLKWLRDDAANTPDTTRERALALKVVNGDPSGERDHPTDEDIERLARWTNTGVGERRDRPDWYQLLRETQGNPDQILAAGFIEDGSTFPTNSLFAEYGYIVDLDAMTFEAYEGFQRAPHTKGRFAGRESRENGYYPCALVESWPLTALPTDEAFLAAFGGDEDR